MEKDKKLILLCNKIIGVVGFLFFVMECVSRNFLSAGLILVLLSAMVIPISLCYKKWTVETSSTLLCIGAYVVVLVIECFKSEVDLMFPLYIACFAVGAMFFRLSLLKVQAMIVNVTLLVIFIFFRVQLCSSGDISYLIRALLGMNACFFLIYTAIKWGNGFMRSAEDSHAENGLLLDQVQEKLMENQHTAEKQHELLAHVHQSAQDIFKGSKQVDASAQALSQSSTEQASAVSALASQMEDISTQVDKTVQNAEKACQQVNLAGESVVSCNAKMQEMTNAMSTITHKSNEIGKIIKTIEDIAFQTNILALNAAVEAARAGTAGKGFAVVADEVRNLANKSSEASKNTAALIEDSIAAIERGMEIARVAAEALTDVTSSQQLVSSTVAEIASAAQLQTQSISQVTEGIMQISQTVQYNSSSAQESSGASEQLFGQVRILQELVSRFEKEEAMQLAK